MKWFQNKNLKNKTCFTFEIMNSKYVQVIFRNILHLI